MDRFVASGGDESDVPIVGSDGQPQVSSEQLEDFRRYYESHEAGNGDGEGPEGGEGECSVVSDNLHQG